jgi:protein involved in polysaccharide export with SLBB domain
MKGRRTAGYGNSMRKTAAVLAMAAALTGPAAAVSQPAFSTAAAADQTYVLGAGDRVRITTFGEDDLSGEFAVGDAGKVAMPLAGGIDAAGRTVRDFQAAVETALRGRYLRDPKVSVEVLNHRPFYILGEVNRPGAYPFVAGLTVLNAVATAQGFTYRANTKRVFVKHAGEAKEEVVRLGPALQVRPGDTVRIGERLF